MSGTTWSDEAKERWLTAQKGTPTHVVTFEPIYQVEMCIPPWEHTDRRIARCAVEWGRRMSRVFEDLPHELTVVAAHHEGNALEVHTAVRPRPYLHRIP